MSKLRVYLVGPIRGCNDEQRTWWRREVKQALKKDFEFEDPTEWADDFVVSREIGKLEACDLLLANMWKESIGTTLGIVRARHQGKPVVLVDSNRIHNAILSGLVAPEKPVHTIEDACRRLRELAAEFKPFVVRKRDGAEQAFSQKKLVRSVSLAAAAAGVTDAALEEQISGPVIARLRREGGRRGLLETAEIRAALFDRLGWMSADPGQPLEFRSRAQAVLEAWQRREAVKVAERATVEAQQSIAALQAERAALLEQLKARDARIRELERNPPPVVEPLPEDLSEALRRAQIDFAGSLIVHDRAFGSAEASPYRDVTQAWEALQLLGRYAAERQLAELMGTRFAGTRQWFKDHQDEAPGVEYAAKESEMVTAKFPGGRKIVHEGVTLFAEQHLCLGDSFDPQFCLRIHFAPFEDKVVVAYCGRHLRNTKSG
jgi:ATP cone domain